MESIGEQTVVVGIDGSTSSDAALAWAVDEASRRGLRLHLFSAAVCEAHSGGSVDDDAHGEEAIVRAALESADAHLAEALTAVSEAAPRLTVTIGSGLDWAGGTLVDLSARAHSVVVGRSGHGPVMGAVLGSVVSYVVIHAKCPVVVVHTSSQNPTGQRGVAVAVGGAAGSEAALAYAFEQASLRGVLLHLVHAWWTRATARATPDTQVDQITHQRLALAELTAGWSERYPDVEVRVSMPVGPTVRAITDAARGAELLVVGSRGRGGFRSLLLGSVSQGVLRHAASTVVVVHAPRDGPGRS